MRNEIYINKLTVKNLKNIKAGTIKFNEDYDLEKVNHLTGIYGPNNSGKTSAIDSLYLLKELIGGNPLLIDLNRIISIGEKDISLEAEFMRRVGDNRYKISYSVLISRAEESRGSDCVLYDTEDADKVHRFKIDKESLSYCEIKGEECLETVTFLEYLDGNLTFCVKEDVSFSKKNDYTKYVAKVSAQGDNSSSDKILSHIFKGDNLEYLEKSSLFKVCKDVQSYEKIIDMLNSMKQFAKDKMVVIKEDLCDGNHYELTEEKLTNSRVDKDSLQEKIALFKKFSFSNDNILMNEFNLSLLTSMIGQLNTVLKEIMPELRVDIVYKETSGLEDDREAYSVKLFTSKNIDDNRKEFLLPLADGSYGIKKLLLLLIILIEVCNKQLIVVLDDVDKGIFEYLLAELIDSIEYFCRGQFIFTSHNLILLERLDKKSLVFASVNPFNKYIAIKPDSEKCCNVRSEYLRAIVLGGQEEDMYEGKNKVYISRGLRKAWNI